MWKSLLAVALLCNNAMSLSAQHLADEQKNQKLKILLISDLNDSYGTVGYSQEVKDVISNIGTIQPDIILCGGDMVAGQKTTLNEGQLRAMWTGFQDQVLTPISAKKIPFGFTMGNHDASPSYVLDREVSSEFWQNNKSKTNLTFVDDTHFPFYFSYIKNNIFFISWDASSSVIPVEVKEWMQEQFSSAAAKKARGRIVLGHLPLYAIVASKNKSGEVLDRADETLDFLKQHDVDMYISGHQHAYYPATKEKVTLLNSGCLGGGPRSLLGHSAAPQKAYAVIEVAKNKKRFKAEITGYEPRFHTHIPLHALPTQVTGFNGTINRIDQK